ncbi:MAG: GNAT family N-acetyltransferase [Proteobacteria bacterium]|nr:GNAT family N-acetyltransferase [Pseudomonadota bacterium]
MSGWHVEPLGGGLGAWAMAWDHLNRRLNGGHPLLDSRFVDALLTHFGAGDEYLCAHRNGQGVDGLCLLRRKGPGRWESFLPDQAPLGPLLLADAAMLGTLVRDLPGRCLALDLLCIDPRFSPEAAAWPGPLGESGHALTIDVDFSTGAAAYWAARPKKLVANLNRYRRRAEAAGWVPRLVHHTASGDLPAALDRYGALESAGWKGRAGTAVAADNPQGRFYLDVLTRFAASGEAAVHEYRFGERLAASRLTIAGPAMSSTPTPRPTSWPGRAASVRSCTGPSIGTARCSACTPWSPAGAGRRRRRRERRARRALLPRRADGNGDARARRVTGHLRAPPSPRGWRRRRG